MRRCVSSSAVLLAAFGLKNRTKNASATYPTLCQPFLDFFSIFCDFPPFLFFPTKFPSFSRLHHICMFQDRSEFGKASPTLFLPRLTQNVRICSSANEHQTCIRKKVKKKNTQRHLHTKTQRQTRKSRSVTGAHTSDPDRTSQTKLSNPTQNMSSTNTQHCTTML